MAGGGTGTFPRLRLEVARGPSHGHGWRWHGDLLVAMAPRCPGHEPQPARAALALRQRPWHFPRVPPGCGLRRAEPGEPWERAGEVRKTPIKPH